MLVVCYAWLVFMQLTRDLFAIAKFLLSAVKDQESDMLHYLQYVFALQINYCNPARLGD